VRVACTTEMGFASTVLGQTMRVLAVAKALSGRGHEVFFYTSKALLPIVESQAGPR